MHDAMAYLEDAPQPPRYHAVSTKQRLFEELKLLLLLLGSWETCYLRGGYKFGHCESACCHYRCHYRYHYRCHY